MTAYLFDTETTGTVEPEIIEAAWLELRGPRPLTAVHPAFSGRYKPSKPIELGAMAVHHITDDDVADQKPSAEFTLPDDAEYLIGHHIDFDWQAAGSPECRRICTLALARKLWPSLDSHSLGALIYHLKRESARELLRNAHGAVYDVWANVALLQCILDKLPTAETWEKLWLLSEGARVPDLMPFGKHKGSRIADQVPDDYKRWLLGQSDVDPYLRKALSA